MREPACPTYTVLPFCPRHSAGPAPRRRNPAEKDYVRFKGETRLRKAVVEAFERGDLLAKAAAKGMITTSALPGNNLWPTWKHLNLLGSSRKVVKGLKVGVATAVLYLAPSSEAFTDEHSARKTQQIGRQFMGLCPYATSECSDACLGHSAGQLAMDDSYNARRWKTILFMCDRPLFDALILSEIAVFENLVWKKSRGKIRPAVRFDGSSDTGYGAVLAPNFPGAYSGQYGNMKWSRPGVMFYDYTKNPDRMRYFLGRNYPPNYHLTFSFSGHNEEDCVQVLRSGGNVAAVFDAGYSRHCNPIPAFWHPDPARPSLRFPVIDADETDVRFEDPPGHVAGLRFKGNTGAEEAGKFVVRAGRRQRMLPRLEKNPRVPGTPRWPPSPRGGYQSCACNCGCDNVEAGAHSVCGACTHGCHDHCDGCSWCGDFDPDETLRGNPGDDELRRLERQGAYGDPAALFALRAAQERRGIPGSVRDAMLAAVPMPKKGVAGLTVGGAKQMIQAWLRANGWQPDFAANSNRALNGDLWISADGQRRAAFSKASMSFEIGGRGAWQRDKDFEASLGKTMMGTLGIKQAAAALLGQAR